MPELPEVETVVRELRAILPGRRVRRAALTAHDLYRKDSERLERLAGARILDVTRRGKAILIQLEPGADAASRLVVHLGMTGRLEWRDVSAPRERVAPDGGPATSGASRSGVAGDRPRERRQADDHLHARWQFDDGSELCYFDPRRFGYIFVGDAESVDRSLDIGPDPFQLDAAELARLLQHRRAPVKALLLDQHLVSGLGNIYVDEALHLARIHPLTSGEAASRNAGRILAAARRILERAIRARGTTLRDYRRTDGATGGFQLKLSVYGREGGACRTCGTTIRRIVVGQRGTHFCPYCQPRPRGRQSTRRTSAKTSRAGRSRRAVPRRAGYTPSP